MAQRTGLHVSYDLHPAIEGLPEPIEETLWKVGQEALTNIERHAQASNILLHISRQNGHIVMRIQDDGIGLPVAFYHLQEDGHVTCASPEGHFGLNGMLERVENNDGHLYLYPVEDHGTIVEVELPLVEAPLASTLEAQALS
jgi:signal transduction histidine kinase